MSKTIKTRIQNKHDLEVNWLLAENFVPMQGELIIYDVEVDKDGNTLTKEIDGQNKKLLPDGRDIPYNYERFKIGDGINAVTALPFVYYTKDEIDSELSTIRNEIPDVSQFITSVPDEYITESELTAKGYLTEHQDLSAYALTSSIPTKVSELTNDSAFITESGLESKKYVTETALEAKKYLTEHQDISGKADKVHYHAEYLTEHQSLEEYAKKTDIPTDHVTKSELEAKGYITDISGKADKNHEHTQYLTEHQSLADYAKKSDLTDFIKEIPTEYITESELSAKKYLTEIPTEYITETELTAKGYLTEHQSLADYATKTYVEAEILKAQLAEEEVDLSEYAKKSEIPDVSNFITAVPDEYITETELANKGYVTDISGKADKNHEHTQYLTEHQSLAGLATTQELNNLINCGTSTPDADTQGKFYFKYAIE